MLHFISFSTLTVLSEIFITFNKRCSTTGNIFFNKLLFFTIYYLLFFNVLIHIMFSFYFNSDTFYKK